MSLQWSTHSEYRGTRNDDVTQPYSLRGLALSADGASIYGGFIQSKSRASIRRVSATPIDTLIVDGSPLITALAPTPQKQAKGLAVDDRGNVYAALNPFGPADRLDFGIYTSDLADGELHQSVSPFTAEAGGIAVQRSADRYYVYLTRCKGAGMIERWDATDTTAAFRDTAWGTNGRVNLAAQHAGAECLGVKADADGTIFIAGKCAQLGGTVFRLATDGTPATAVGVDGASDVAVYGDQIFVTQYLNAHSTIAVLDKKTLALVTTLAPTIPHPSGDLDSGYSGIAISPSGMLYVADQIFKVVKPYRTYHDRILMAQL